MAEQNIPQMFKRYYERLDDSEDCKMCVTHRNLEGMDEFQASQHNLKHCFYIKRGESKNFKLDVSNYSNIAAIELKLGSNTYRSDYYTIVEDPCYRYVDFNIPSNETLAMDVTDLIQNELAFEMDILLKDGKTVIIPQYPVVVLESQCTGIIRQVAVLSDDTKCGDLMVCGELLQ